MCKISVRNDTIKDILKKKNDVHWISDGTVVNISFNIRNVKLLYVKQKYITVFAGL